MIVATLFLSLFAASTGYAQSPTIKVDGKTYYRLKKGQLCLKDRRLTHKVTTVFAVGGQVKKSTHTYYYCKRTNTQRKKALPPCYAYQGKTSYSYVYLANDQKCNGGARKFSLGGQEKYTYCPIQNVRLKVCQPDLPIRSRGTSLRPSIAKLVRKLALQVECRSKTWPLKQCKGSNALYITAPPGGPYTFTTDKVKGKEYRISFKNQKGGAVELEIQPEAKGKKLPPFYDPDLTGVCWRGKVMKRSCHDANAGVAPSDDEDVKEKRVCVEASPRCSEAEYKKLLKLLIRRTK
ncbi:MAG: hypothetical protein HQ530_01985 [Parcubacteria group bacterium]|nr:hypothetical protein [Parcubacteria group bacterium]